MKDQKANPANAAKNLQAAVKTLEGNAKGEELNRAYMLGSVLALWLNQPNVGLTPKRSVVGFSSNPDATINLPTTIDSLFKIVEASKPGCSYYTAYWRGGQQAYLDMVNNAIAALNADKLDSAQYYASVANTLYSGSPYGSMVLGNIASKKGNNDEAVKHWQTAATAASSDTVYRDVQRQVLGNIASVHMAVARDDKTPKAGQVEAAKKAAEVYTQLLAIPGTTGSYAVAGRQNLQSALLIVGDTTAVTKSYAEMLTNPTAFDHQQLLTSAVAAVRANRNADAAKLFENALVVNPYSRDALFNLAVTHLNLGQSDKVPALVTRLVAVDPGNPENYLLAARAYVDIAKTRKGAAATAAVNDTTVSWFSRGQKLPVEVTFTEFNSGEKQLELVGRVADRRDKAAEADVGSTTTTRSAAARAAAAKKAAAKASFSPKPVTLKFEALDKSGAVLGTQSITTEALEPGKSAQFRVTIPAANAEAYRYTIAE
ncbi:MAG TPA: FxLYD domain-containing protein [Gemmatimonadaceae bacterium]|nr:FxLYD domain-containing protein [Gemmatimonadaceae bacterium]